MQLKLSLKDYYFLFLFFCVWKKQTCKFCEVCMGKHQFFP